MALALEPMTFRKGQPIILQGAVGDSFFILKTGIVAVMKCSVLEKGCTPDGQYGDQVQSEIIIHS
mgnify:CR=1 FL=1